MTIPHHIVYKLSKHWLRSRPSPASEQVRRAGHTLLDSQARIVEPPRRIALPSGDAGDVERAVNFPFRVRWSTLFVAIEPAKSTVPVIVLNEHPVSDFPVTKNPSDNGTPRVSQGTAKLQEESSDSTVQWEMVVPKMARPSSKISAITESAPPPLPRPEPLALNAADAPDSVPQSPATRHWTFQLQPGALSLAGKLLLGGALAAGVATPILLRVYRPRPQASVDAAIPGGSWMRQLSAPKGAPQARQMVLYRPSLGATDCRLEFTWKVSDRALAWTFRAKDPENYYGMAIKTLRPGPSPALSVEHFTVYHGIESPHASKVLILAENSPALRIRMDVNGAAFKLYLEGNAADYWTDNRLTAGGLGFLEQLNQPAAVERVRMSFLPAGGA